MQKLSVTTSLYHTISGFSGGVVGMAGTPDSSTDGMGVLFQEGSKVAFYTSSLYLLCLLLVLLSLASSSVTAKVKMRKIAFCVIRYCL